MKARSGERCAICGCRLHRGGDYARPTVEGRSHATEHHYVAERFFGRSANRRGTTRDNPIFQDGDWPLDKKTEVYCYECHEELIHNPVFLPEDIAALSALVEARSLSEEEKTDDRGRLAGRIRLLHDVIHAGLNAMKKQRSC
jgi:hypothetical protein